MLTVGSIPYTYLSAVKQQITLQKTSPVEGALQLFSAGGAEFEVTPLIIAIFN